MSETAFDELMSALAPLAKAMSVPGIDSVPASNVVQMRDHRDPTNDWQCGGLTHAHLQRIANAYRAIKDTPK